MNNQTTSLEFSIFDDVEWNIKIALSTNKNLLDCTFGGGGYQEKYLGTNTYVKAIDRDVNYR